jgi:mono/diheme cytochrome c family protein
MMMPVTPRLAWIALAGLFLVAGCDAPQARFVTNKTYLRKQELLYQDVTVSRPQLQDLVNALAALFGTPDEPHFVSDAAAGTDGVVTLDHLIRAAGPVSTDQFGQGRGLYRQHCVHCHGVSGNGAGPTASFLNPYPRDFRSGRFKFKSTPRGMPPTDEDLRRVLVNGVEGTAMPSFRLLKEGELTALIDYVKYLSIRGMVERALIDQTIELEEGGRLDTSRSLVEVTLAEVVSKWQSAAPTAPVPPRVPFYTGDRAEWTDEQRQVVAESVQRGRNLYFGTVANCFTCHGNTQLGDGETSDYDDWAKEFHDWSKEKDPAILRAKMSDYAALNGGLPPRNIQPRNLRLGQYRGGRRPIDLYWRIHNGIDGTPMPLAALRPAGAGPEMKGLTTDDIWDLVNFVLALPYEELSHPGFELPTNERIRPY